MNSIDGGLLSPVRKFDGDDREALAFPLTAVENQLQSNKAHTRARLARALRFSNQDPLHLRTVGETEIGDREETKNNNGRMPV